MSYKPYQNTRPPNNLSDSFQNEQNLDDTWGSSDENSHSQPSTGNYQTSTGNYQTQIQSQTNKQDMLNTRQPVIQPNRPVGRDNFPIMTDEDILFLKRCRKEALYTRVYPLMSLSLGSYYFYNKTKNLPHIVPKYIGIGILSFILGKVIYLPTLQKRYLESNLNTPLMKYLREAQQSSIRQANGISQAGFNNYLPPTSSDSFQSSTNNQIEQQPADNFNWETTSYSTEPASTTEYGFQNDTDRSVASSNNQAKQRTSYNELRQKHRTSYPI